MLKEKKERLEAHFINRLEKRFSTKHFLKPKLVYPNFKNQQHPFVLDEEDAVKITNDGIISSYILSTLHDFSLRSDAWTSLWWKKLLLHLHSDRHKQWPEYEVATKTLLQKLISYKNGLADYEKNRATDDCTRYSEAGIEEAKKDIIVTVKECCRKHMSSQNYNNVNQQPVLATGASLHMGMSLKLQSLTPLHMCTTLASLHEPSMHQQKVFAVAICKCP
jgi:hypothetical protein